MRVWRLSDSRFSATMWSGEGAKVHGGRWNNKGTAIIYTSATKSLAALEQLVQMVTPRILSGYVVSSIELEPSQIESVEWKSLPTGWNSPVAGAASKAFGDAWIRAGKSLALVIPSIVIQGETNYLINPVHPDFSSAARSVPEPFSHDPRLI